MTGQPSPGPWTHRGGAIFDADGADIAYARWKLHHDWTDADYDAAIARQTANVELMAKAWLLPSIAESLKTIEFRMEIGMFTLALEDVHALLAKVSAS